MHCSSASFGRAMSNKAHARQLLACGFEAFPLLLRYFSTGFLLLRPQWLFLVVRVRGMASTTSMQGRWLPPLPASLFEFAASFDSVKSSDAA